MASYKYKIGVDEAGRGPMFGRVYAAAVVLPDTVSTSIQSASRKTADFTHIKDSKKFSSKKKLRDVADFIKNNAVAWYVSYADEATIDRINILQATQNAMHMAINQVLGQLEDWNAINTTLEVDGNYFRQHPELEHMCFEGGDASHKNIAAASILAKLARDDYMDELCVQHPRLGEIYGLNKNYGYGTKQHMDAIRQYGITPWHRRSFGLCKSAPINKDFADCII